MVGEDINNNEALRPFGEDDGFKSPDFSPENMKDNENKLFNEKYLSDDNPLYRELKTKFNTNSEQFKRFFNRTAEEAERFNSQENAIQNDFFMAGHEIGKAERDLLAQIGEQITKSTGSNDVEQALQFMGDIMRDETNRRTIGFISLVESLHPTKPSDSRDNPSTPENYKTLHNGGDQIMFKHIDNVAIVLGRHQEFVDSDTVGILKQMDSLRFDDRKLTDALIKFAEKPSEENERNLDEVYNIARGKWLDELQKVEKTVGNACPPLPMNIKILYKKLDGLQGKELSAIKNFVHFKYDNALNRYDDEEKKADEERAKATSEIRDKLEKLFK